MGIWGMDYVIMYLWKTEGVVTPRPGWLGVYRPSPIPPGASRTRAKSLGREQSPQGIYLDSEGL